MPSARTTLTLTAAIAAVLVGASPAAAKCTRLAFSVNDYGKEGPTKDAKSLLDKYIAQWMSERGIKTYNVGKKDVSCELFLDFGVFDEHTCKAAATVCWSEGGASSAEATPAGKSPAAKPRSSNAAPPAAQPAAPARAAAPIATGGIAAPAPKPAQ